ncbi:GntP family permease [Nocardioides albus]|uniref:GntP family gluconate:H+ symporter n=1 Tax=Nocardioides albus TaxID=1841 RepID=A0A7W5A7I2_9ACTN|nr:GntP family permease [Nocardioides albus]MBB3090860.1 GntP family gluconate:H+ symporter [Nocardioides albus]GGU37987.1 permease [Nocardioides albus]
MEPLTPAYPTWVMLLIAAVAVVVLLVLIAKVKLHAFISLVLVSAVTAVAAGIPVADVPTAMLTGFSATLGSVALLVAFGVMLGRLLEVTGGAQVLADTLIGAFGEKRAPLALGVAALIFGFPIFFDAGLVVFLPIIFAVARRFGGSILLYALPTAASFAVMHAVVPPHPGPVAAATELGGDIGLTLLIGVPVAVLAWIPGGYLVGTRLGARFNPAPTNVFAIKDSEENPADEIAPPPFSTVVLLLALPLVLIGLNTVITTLIAAETVSENATWASALVLVGQTPIALLITVLIALLVLSPGRFPIGRASDILDQALGPICAIILITGAGGMFGGVLRTSGIGEALSTSLSGLGMSLIVQAFLIATLLRVAQGSATVALTTTAGLISAQVAAAGLSSFDISLLVFAIAAGATVLSHVNDSGFWLVSRFFGMDVITTLKTWTVLETTLGLSVFAIAGALWVVVP